MSLSITTIIIIITVGASLYAWSKPYILQRWVFNPYSVYTKREYFRFITSGFIHQDYMHLFFNMFTLYFFGNMVEQAYGDLLGTTGLVLYVVMYLLSIIISDVSTYVKHRHDPGYNSLGASGGVSAVILSAILFDPTNNLYLFALIPIPGFIFGALFLIYSFQRSKQTGDRINHDAHLYGALFGMLFTIILEPDVIGSFFRQIAGFRLFN